jgi:integrase/recombinase XerD
LNQNLWAANREQKSEKRQRINKEQMKELIDSDEWICNKAMFLFFAKTGVGRQELIDFDV